MEIYTLDIETSGLNRFKDRILAIGVYSPNFNQCFGSVSDFNAWYCNLIHPPLFITHNGAFDVGFLRHNNIDLRGSWWMDTCSLASILVPRPESLGLENLVKTYLGHDSYKLDRTKMESYSFSVLSNYCLTDCRYTWELFELFKEKLKGKSWSFVENWLMPATFFCADMEYDGVWIDQKGLSAYNDEMVAKRDQILVGLKERAKNAIMAYHELQVVEVRNTYKEMYEKAKEKAEVSISKGSGKLFLSKEHKQTKILRRYALLEAAAISRLEPFNWNSSDQLKWLFKDYYGLNIFNKREEKETTNEAMLVELSRQNEVAKQLLFYRETEKLVSTCIPALLENLDPSGFCHTRYHIGGTRTGRLSSSSPNLQQIPKGKLRSYIQAVPPISSESILVTIDYAQIEVRIIAEVAKERELINAFNEEIDPYSIIAQKLLKIDCDVRYLKEKFKKERDVAKTAGLSILYGTGAYKLQEVLNKELSKNYSISECRKFIEDYRHSLPAVKDFKQKLEQNLANGKPYYNLLGRPFSIESNDEIYMKSLNTLVQGSASDLVLYSALKVKQKLHDLKVPHKCRLLIHDEQVWELPKDEAELLVTEVIIPAMTADIQKELNLTVPLKVEYNINRSWEKP